jgi:hypothetical protein
MKFNWGHGIVVTLILFTGLIGTMVYLSVQQRIDLVTEEYYGTEDEYQERRYRLERGRALSETLMVVKDGDVLRIEFPEAITTDIIQGTITFYNPRDKRLDFVEELKSDRVQEVDISSVAGGVWTLKIDIPGDSGYYFEESLYL